MLTSPTLVPRGQFFEARLQLRSGAAIHLDTGFLDEWASFLMDHYESEQPAPNFLVVTTIVLERPERTKRFYRRLFTDAGEPTLDFISWATETLAWWMEVTFGSVVFAEGNLPHTNDPVYDVVSVVLNDRNVYTLRLVQAKATRRALNHNCNLALSKFCRQEEGHYDTELKAKLQLLQRCGLLPPHVLIRDLLYDPEKRYRLIVVHGEDRNQVQILTTFDAKVGGSIERRSACLVHVPDWPALWKALGKVVYAKLS